MAAPVPEDDGTRAAITGETPVATEMDGELATEDVASGIYTALNSLLYTPLRISLSKE